VAKQIRVAVLEEREACAQEAERLFERYGGPALDLRDLIRARK
jgi:hypothetical protein